MSLIFEAVQRLESERGRLDARPGPEVVDLLRLAENKVASIRETASRATIEQARLSDPPAPAPLPVQLPAPAPSPALAVTSAEPPLQLPAGVRRAVALVGAALPIVERILPLFEGNFRDALTNLLTPPPPRLPLPRQHRRSTWPHRRQSRPAQGPALRAARSGHRTKRLPRQRRRSPGNGP